MQKKGFTLLELLIVIGILAILSIVLIVVLNPAETLKKSRDSQRLSDLSSIKTALGLYLVNTNTPFLGGNSSNATCRDTPTASWGAADRIYYSFSSPITDITLDGSSSVLPATTTAANTGNVDSTGWIPVNLSSLSDGSPISNFPIDPLNTIADVAVVTNTDFVYRYACSASPLVFEVDAQLESNAYTSADDKRAKDGGNSALIFEVGTDLRLLGGSGGF